MPKYVGIDAHKESCTLAVLGQSGRRLQTQVVQTRASELREAIQGIAGHKHMCLEEGMHAEWLCEVLEPLVHAVTLVQPGSHTGSKDDRSDAWRLAHHIRKGEPGKTTKAPRRLAPLRQSVATYLVTRKDLARAKTRLRHLCVSRGIQVTSALYSPDDRDAFLDQLPAAYRDRGYILGQQVDSLEEVHQQALRWMVEASRPLPEVRRLTTIPGLGTARAAVAVAKMISPWRFRTKRQLWAYSGLAVVTRSSSDWVMHGDRWVRARVPQTRGLNKNRNPALKDVFVGAAQTMCTVHGPLRDTYLRLVRNGTKPNLARLTLARRIAAIALAIWKRQEEYDPAKVTIAA